MLEGRLGAARHAQRGEDLEEARRSRQAETARADAADARNAVLAADNDELRAETRSCQEKLLQALSLLEEYQEEMTDFIVSNPGLRSRFKTYVDFPDYSPSELAEIFEGMVRDVGIELADGALAAAENLFARAAERQDFGNARFARSLFEQAYARMAARASRATIAA